MNTKTQLDKVDSIAAGQPAAVTRKTEDVLRFTLDRQMKPVRTYEQPADAVRPLPQGANYLPFWDDGGAWMPMPVRDGLSSGSLLDSEYTI